MERLVTYKLTIVRMSALRVNMGAGIEQWSELSPPTNVVWVRYRPMCGLSLLLVLALLRGGFLWVCLIQQFQFDQSEDLSKVDVAS